GTHGGMAMAPAMYSVAELSRQFSLTARGVLLISRTLTTATVFMLTGTRASRSASSSARAAGRTTSRAKSDATRRGIMGHLMVPVNVDSAIDLAFLRSNSRVLSRPALSQAETGWWLHSATTTGRC